MKPDKQKFENKDNENDQKIEVQGWWQVRWKQEKNNSKHKIYENPKYDTGDEEKGS